MTEIERIKEILKKDKNFYKSFLGVKDVKAAVAVARSKGFGITKDDVLSDKELSDYLLEASAGGGWSAKDIFLSICCPAYALGKAISDATNKEDKKPNTQINNTYNINNQNTQIIGDNNTVQEGIQNSK